MTNCASGSWTNCVPQAEVLGVDLPDPDLRWNPTGATTTSPHRTTTNMRRVVRGDGPCNRQRVGAPTRVHEDGAGAGGGQRLRGQA